MAEAAAAPRAGCRAAAAAGRHRAPAGGARLRPRRGAHARSAHGEPPGLRPGGPQARRGVARRRGFLGRACRSAGGERLGMVFMFHLTSVLRNLYILGRNLPLFPRIQRTVW